MRGAEFAERFLALFERLVVAVESIANSFVKRNVLPEVSSPFPIEKASGERLALPPMAPEDRRRLLASIRQQRRRDKIKHSDSQSMPTTGAPMKRDAERDDLDARSVTERDFSERDDHHVSSRSSVTRHAVVGGRGGSILEERSREISPISSLSGSQGDQIARAGKRDDQRDASRTTKRDDQRDATRVTKPIAPMARTARSPTDDGCFGMAVAAWVEGVRSVTGRDYLSPQGSELNLLLVLIETHAKDPEQRIDWARTQGAAFARSAPHKLNVFAFKDFVQTPPPLNRVQPGAATEEERTWSLGKKRG